MTCDSQERRVDPADGNSYTKLEFFEEYGDYVQWDRSSAGRGDAADQPRAPARSQSFRRRRQRAGAHLPIGR